MQVVILCAGFATRMYPLTENFPKPLLKVADKAVIDYLIDQIVALPQVAEINIVSNAKFHDHFLRWQRDRYRSGSASEKAVHIQITNDGSTANENRLGAAADLQLAFHKMNASGRILVSAGDNIFRFPIKPLWEKFMQSDKHYVVALPEKDTEKLQRTGVLELSDNDRVLQLHEKPRMPPSNWVCPPLYFFQPSVREQLDSFLQSSGNHDAPGHFISHLCRLEPIHAFRLESSRLDIGSIDTYHEADRFLRENSILDWRWAGTGTTGS